MKNFWQRLPRPFFILAPMDDVTDVVFREVVACLSVGKPDVFFTEFTNVEGLCSVGREALLPRLKFTENQRPIVAQIWGSIPKNFEAVAGQLVEMGFDGIDINMGCPEKGVVSRGQCAGLIENYKLAGEIIEATLKGAQGKIPVSIKTRIGIKEIVTDKWIPFLLQFPLAAITVHGRTAREMSKVPAHWEEIETAVQLRDARNESQDTLIIGNGDVRDRKHGLELAERYGVDGVMIGRGIFESIFAFSVSADQSISVSKKVELLLDHARLFDKTWGKTKPFVLMRKFAKIYIKDFPGASGLRVKLMETNSLKDLEEELKRWSCEIDGDA